MLLRLTWLSWLSWCSRLGAIRKWGNLSFFSALLGFLLNLLHGFVADSFLLYKLSLSILAILFHLEDLLVVVRLGFFLRRLLLFDVVLLFLLQAALLFHRQLGLGQFFLVARVEGHFGGFAFLLFELLLLLRVKLLELLFDSLVGILFFYDSFLFRYLLQLALLAGYLDHVHYILDHALNLAVIQDLNLNPACLI